MEQSLAGSLSQVKMEAPRVSVGPRRGPSSWSATPGFEALTSRTTQGGVSFCHLRWDKIGATFSKTESFTTRGGSIIFSKKNNNKKTPLLKAERSGLFGSPKQRNSSKGHRKTRHQDPLPLAPAVTILSFFSNEQRHPEKCDFSPNQPQSAPIPQIYPIWQIPNQQIQQIPRRPQLFYSGVPLMTKSWCNFNLNCKLSWLVIPILPLNFCFTSPRIPSNSFFRLWRCQPQFLVIAVWGLSLQKEAECLCLPKSRFPLRKLVFHLLNRICCLISPVGFKDHLSLLDMSFFRGLKHMKAVFSLPVTENGLKLVGMNEPHSQSASQMLALPGMGRGQRRHRCPHALQTGEGAALRSLGFPDPQLRCSAKSLCAVQTTRKCHSPSGSLTPHINQCSSW